MDSDDDNHFAKQGGEALDLDGDFNDSEEVDAEEDDDNIMHKGKDSGNKGGKDVKGEKLDNQPYDLAVDVNDSEEIESDEEDDEVNPMNTKPPGQAAAHA
jgi:hypothetical protein